MRETRVTARVVPSIVVRRVKAARMAALIGNQLKSHSAALGAS